jgi:hypothetical protein
MAKIVRDGSNLKYVYEYPITAEEIKYLLDGGTYAGGEHSVMTILEPTDENVNKVLEALVGKEMRESDEDYSAEEIFCEIVQEAIDDIENNIEDIVEITIISREHEEELFQKFVKEAEFQGFSYKFDADSCLVCSESELPQALKDEITENIDGIINCNSKFRLPKSKTIIQLAIEM